MYFFYCVRFTGSILNNCSSFFVQNKKGDELALITALNDAYF